MTNKDNPLVTVYITNYNYGRYLEWAIESVLKQTFQDFELLIIDDGSTDGSAEIIERYTGLPGVFTIFQQNKGLNVSNNIALRMARGNYLMRLDADDYLEPNALGVLSGVLERKPEVGLVFPDYYLVDPEGNVTDIVCRNNAGDVQLQDLPAHGACTMIRKDCLSELGGYDESFRCQDGYDLWIRFIARYKVDNVNLPLFYYRQHPESLTRNEERILDTRRQILEKWTSGNGGPMHVIGVVPVRGKVANPSSLALNPLAGKPLVEWTLDAALASQRLSKVILTSPDQELLEHVRKRYGDQIMAVERHIRFAGFNTHISDTVLHAMEEYSAEHGEPDAVAILFIEAPFRAAANIDTAVDMMSAFKAETVVGVRPESNLVYQHDGGGLKPVRRSSALRLEREDLYRDVGRMHLVRLEYLRRTKLTSGGRMGHVVLDQAAGHNVSSQWDWDLAEHIGRKILDQKG